MSTDEYVPTTDHIRAFWASDGDHVPAAKSYDYFESYAEFERWLAAHDARVRRDAAREALDGLSAWLGDLAEKHPARSAHVPLVQGRITRYITDNYPEETP